MWTILRSDPEKNSRSICLCACGRIRAVNNFDLKVGKSTQCRSCARTTYGRSHEREHRIWEGIINRCTRPTNASFKWYGAVGIGICDRWADKEKGYENFLADMGTAPDTTSSVDRVDNSKGYSRENCRWATRKEQNLNRRTTRWVEIEGEILCAKDAARKLGLAYPTFMQRLNKGVYTETSIAVNNWSEKRKYA